MERESEMTCEVDGSRWRTHSPTLALMDAFWSDARPMVIELRDRGWNVDARWEATEDGRLVAVFSTPLTPSQGEPRDV